MQKYHDYAICVTCKEKVEKKYLLQSSDKTCYCKECFRRRFCTPSGDQKIRPIAKQFCERKSKKLIPFPEIYSFKRPQSTSCVNRNKSASVMSLSKRPLQCPKADCNKFISIFTLEAHFKYEHKEIPIILTQLDSRSALEFYPRDVRYRVTQCIVLLNVINHDFSNIIPRSKPVMVLLATRVAGYELAKEEIEGMYGDSVEEFDCSKTYNESELLLRDDQIIIWMASNVFTNLSYTVAASTLSNKIRQKYFGPMLTLGENPVELCSNGNGLILSHFHINGMSENGTKPLALDVVIHSPD
ncbi:hypothetical protein NQ314_000391 [Rhamnusium bicolor]|uniref:C2H2-type domain-containing protein n=1 Tax=Rhamnusium bicolor TaxID=1586634 RepID=A0AAV8ZW90_9CUCU|nr:hypothetical protein NQ314_000391 [Rhamnusium bicolor]